MQDSSRPVTGYPVQNLNDYAPTPPTTGYSYARVNPNGHPYYSTPPPQNPHPTFLRRLLVAVAVFLIIFGAILFIIWLVLRPQLPDFSIQSLSLSNFSAANQRVNATWNAQIQVSNPNKKLSVSYGEVVSSIFHKDYFLSETRIGPFVQGTRSAGAVGASYSLVDSFVDGKVVDAMNEERSGGEMKFNLKVIADVAFQYGGWRGRRRFLTVWCDDVAVTASSGKMTGGPKKCSVY
ncbi:Detected protein of unknown function [Hibiscus syriacus]|uniref:Late embryogenesis abundant protein LEA-2 subgroup domain-containing protein n=1 Tax=Hibiscus syriacus TaxID=106335 RepID=A0A6A2YGF0_HIBSY|nr:NDR1/HIN1-like protein 26 [Hibiscus syriacus]KAE8678886.1 Detected protein of unknown function [Hibiscus syriacus]